MTGGDLLHLDGQCFAGDAGVLGVALRPGSLASLRRAGEVTHWLLPLEEPAVVAAAADLPGAIFWLCAQPPARVIGALAEDFRGAYLEGGAIAFNLDDSSHCLRLAKRPHPSLAIAYLARMVANIWLDSHVVDQPVLQMRSPQLIAA